MSCPKFHTYDEWHKLGYVIIKGSKAVGRDKNNTALFSESQVKRKLMRNCDYSDDLDYDDGHWFGLTEDWE